MALEMEMALDMCTEMLEMIRKRRFKRSRKDKEIIEQKRYKKADNKRGVMKSRGPGRRITEKRKLKNNGVTIIEHSIIQ